MRFLLSFIGWSFATSRCLSCHTHATHTHTSVTPPPPPTTTTKKRLIFIFFYYILLPNTHVHLLLLCWVYFYGNSKIIMPANGCNVAIWVQHGCWTPQTKPTCNAAAIWPMDNMGQQHWGRTMTPKWTPLAVLHATFGFHLFLNNFFYIFFWHFVTCCSSYSCCIYQIGSCSCQLECCCCRVRHIGNMLQHMHCTCYFMNENWPHVTTISCL